MSTTSTPCSSSFRCSNPLVATSDLPEFRQWEQFARLFAQNFTFAVCIFVGFFPTLITKKIIYGGFLNFGYKEEWFWSSPAILKVTFSSEHGLLVGRLFSSSP